MHVREVMTAGDATHLTNGTITLHPVEARHAADYIRLVNEPSVTDRINAPSPFTQQDFDELLVRLATDTRHFVWVITRDGAMCGIINIADMRAVGVFQGGYWLLPEFRKQGITTQALMLVRDFVIREYNAVRLQALVEPDNAASARVLEKCGYTCEGLLRRFFPARSGKLLDVKMYALVREEA